MTVIFLNNQQYLLLKFKINSILYI